MRKSVLIVTELFEPLNSVGAIRPSKFAKYLSKKGTNVTVFTSSKTKISPKYIPEGFQVIYDRDPAPEKSNIIKTGACTQRASKISSNSSLRKELSHVHRQFLAFRAGYLFYKCFVEAVSNGKLDLNKYDVLFTTFGPVGPVLAGLWAKRKNPKITWINDFRDPMVSQLMPGLVKPYYRFIQNKSVDNCDWVTTVSNGYKVRIQTKKNESKFRVIPNGFDVEDKPKSDVADNLSVFSMSYAGALYEGKRDIGPLFKALRRISDEGLLPAEKIQFHYAGNEIRYLVTQAKEYDMDGVLVNHGFLSRRDCLQLQADSRFLVLSTWNDKGEEGVFPGKFIEYMLIDKPIISIVDGALSGSEVTEVIKKYCLGISYESADPSTEQALYEWLKSQAIRFTKGEPVEFTPDRKGIIQTYDWAHIVERFCELIDG